MAESVGKSVPPTQKPDNSSVVRPGRAGVTPDIDEEEYDPVIHRSQENLNSDTEVFMHLFKCTIGSGILFLPYAFKETGTVSSIVSSIFIGTLATYTAVTVVKCSQILCKRLRVPSMNLGEVAQFSFESGPESLRKYERTFKVTTNVIVCFVEYQTVVIYALYVATSAQQIVEYFSTIVWDIRIYVLISTPIYCLMAVLPNLKYLAPVSIIGSIFMIGGFLATLYYFFENMENPSRMNLYTDVLAVPVYCTIFLFSMQNICVLMPLENSMKTPGHLPVLLIASMTFNIVIYVLFGFFGYNKYEDACDTVIKNLPLNQALAQAVKIAITLSIMFGYGIHYFIPVSILWPMISERVSEDRRTIYGLVFRIGGVIATILAAIAMPFMGPLLGFFSSLSFTTITLLFPGIIELATKWDRSKNPKTLLIKNLLIFLVWIIVLVIGSYESIRKMTIAYEIKKSEDSIC